ncbi:MAG: response regulator [Rhodospirillaceae bacterium]|nr:response regulator [Rhodospirillaceae bacterium]
MTGPSLPTPEGEDTARWILLRLKPLAEDEPFEFDDDENEIALARYAQPWSILVVDDDLEVHRAVELALMMVKIHGRPLQLCHCASAAEARALLLGGSQVVDLVLLDVVMETADAGLALLEEIRTLPVMRDLPVLLHTGQPGQAPEQVVRAQYDVSGYLTKSTVTRQVLIGALDTILGGSNLAT